MNAYWNRLQSAQSCIRAAPWSCVLGLAMLFVAATPDITGAQHAKPTRRTQIQATESELYAAVLFNFAKFAIWPDSAFKNSDSPFIIAVLGANPFPISLKEMEQRTVRGRPVQTRHFANSSDIGDCHVLFCNLDDFKMIDAAIARLKGLPVLTVSADKGFARDGGIIEFSAIDDRMALTINVERARQANVDIGSDLLNLATLVDQPATGPTSSK